MSPTTRNKVKDALFAVRNTTFVVPWLSKPMSVTLGAPGFPTPSKSIDGICE